MELLSTSLVEWSRAQFALTAMYHWLFVPLTLGLGFLQAIMETIYVKTGDEKWKKVTKFWMKLFGINFAIGVATGIIMEFQFGTNWSNYSYFVGDIFGAPLAIEAIVAFFMEATFISIMFFGWNKVNKGTHLTATWLTVAGATLSALWILIANSWMQIPTGMEFNPLTVRNEMVDFWAIITAPVAINKFFHAISSGWVFSSLFVIGISAWFILKKREIDFARKSIRVASIVGFVGVLVIIQTGHTSAQIVAVNQPMKLATIEGLYEGGEGAPLIAWGFVNPKKESYKDDKEGVVAAIKFPKMLSWLAFSDVNAYVPGIKDILEGGYTKPDGTIAPSFEEKKEIGKVAQQALSDFKKAEAAKDTAAMAQHKAALDANFKYFGYGFLENPEDEIPPVAVSFYAFHLMVILGASFLLIFVIAYFMERKNILSKYNWMLWIFILFIPLGYLAGQTGWLVAEFGRQPWSIQGILPVQTAISGLQTSSVVITFILFAILFTGLLIADIGITKKQIQKGPQIDETSTSDEDSY